MLQEPFTFFYFIFDVHTSCAFSASTLLVERQEEHPACKNCVMRCWCGCLSEARCRLFAHGPADAAAIPKTHHILPHLNPDWFYLSGYRLTQVVLETHTQPFNGPLSMTTRVSRYQKGKTNLDFTGARDGEWQWHRLGHKQICTSLQTDNHSSTPPLSFLQAGCPSCRLTNSVRALKALW